MNLEWAFMLDNDGEFELPDELQHFSPLVLASRF